MLYVQEINVRAATLINIILYYLLQTEHGANTAKFLLKPLLLGVWESNVIHFQVGKYSILWNSFCRTR